MGKGHDRSSGQQQHRGGNRKSKARMNYLRKVKQSGGYGGGRGGGRGGGSDDPSTGLRTGYASAYDNRGNRRQNRRELTPGMRGFLLSTNFRESDCVREGYNLLNEYYIDENAAAEASDKKATVSTDAEAGGSSAVNDGVEETTDNTDKPKTEKSGADDDEDDIEAALQKEMQELKHDFAEQKFKAVDTKLKNVVFISTTAKHPTDIVYRIFEDVVKNKESKSRNILRFIPIEGSCYADEASIRKLALDIYPRYFKDGYKSFRVVVNIRFSKITRDETIKILAEVVSEVNPLNVVNLKDAEFTIIAEVIKSTLCLGVVEHFTRFKKFNIQEACAPEKEEVIPKESDGKVPIAEVVEMAEDVPVEKKEPSTESDNNKMDEQEESGSSVVIASTE